MKRQIDRPNLLKTRTNSVSWKFRYRKTIGHEFQFLHEPYWLRSWPCVRKKTAAPFLLERSFFIFLITVNLLTFPVTAVLNALVMISVQTKSRLRAHKSNVLLAFLALTDFTVGILVQPAFAAVLIMLLLNEPRGYCVLKVLKGM